jgi:hypothetical protein
MGTAFVSCPCHLIITWPLALGLLGGTALGATLETHAALIIGAMTAYFFVALLGGSYLLGRVLTKADGGRDPTAALRRRRARSGTGSRARARAKG